MDTYPCPACGGVADEAEGCHSCGRAHDPVAAQLAKLNATLTGLDDQSRQLDDNAHQLAQRRARLQEERRALSRAISQRLSDERRGGADPTAPVTAGATTRTPTGATTTVTAPRAAPPRPTVTIPAPRVPPTGGPPSLPETSPRSAQNTLLTLGGVLLGLAAIVVAGVFYSTTATSGRAVILGLATTLFLGLPVLLTRNTLTATAETIASIGLLLVLLDGYTAYQANLAGIASMAAPLYAAVLFALVTGVAAAYRFATHLRAPQFAALLTVQPLLPLLAINFHLGRIGFAAVFAVVAAFNLGAVVLFGSELAVLAAGRLAITGRRQPPPPHSGLGWPRMLRELAWLLFGLTLAAAAALATAALLQATTTMAAVQATLAVVLAAIVGAVAGQVSGQDRMRRIAGGAATLAVIGAAARIDVLAVRDYTLILTAVLATVIVVVASFLPVEVRRGPQLGALAGAGFAALVVVGDGIAITIAAVRASVEPRVWAADLDQYAQRIHLTSWQVPVAAVLLGLIASIATPAAWRLNATVLGGLVIVLTAPASGLLTWWSIPLLAVVVSTGATLTALYSRTGRDALIRSGSAGLLGLYAVGTSLARPGLTATVCTALALIATATALATAIRPQRFGPYCDAVADAAGGAAAFTLPIAVGTFAWLSGAPGGVILPMTLLATSFGVLGAALSQVAAQVPRTASAGGALVAAGGCLLLSLRIEGTTPADIGVAVVLLAAALATAASRAFETGGSGLVQAVRDTPAAVSALVDAVEGDPTPPEPRRRRVPVDRITLAAALATAALIVALARLVAVAVPGAGLVTSMAMVLITAVGLRALPEVWRRGPRLGGVVVGGAIGAVTAGIAVVEAANAVAASMPFWAADTAGWTARVSSFAPYGSQVPIALLLAAGSAWALLRAPAGGEAGFTILCLSALALPATQSLVWWAPVAIAAGLALLTGIGAALVDRGPAGRAAGRRRLTLALILGGYATAVAAATPASTASLLSFLVFAGALVAGIAYVRRAPALVPGAAVAGALAAAPGAAATVAAASDATANGILGAALVLAGAGVVVAWVLRASGVGWGPAPAFGVGASALVVAIMAALSRPVFADAQVWAAAAALIAVGAAASLNPRPVLGLAADAGTAAAPGPAPRVTRGALACIVLTALPAAGIAIVASANAWITALIGPYRTLRQIWQGYAVVPAPHGARSAVLTLALLALVAGAVAVTLGGRRYLLAAMLPPVAALAVVFPAALGAPVAATAWVALVVALATGLGAALSPPVLPGAAHLLRGTAGVVCAVTGGAGFAGSLATRPGTLVALALIAAAAGLAALVGRDPSVRMVAWFVAAAALFALPIAALAALDADLRSGAFYLLAEAGGWLAVAWWLARTPVRRAEAGVVELSAALGATFALLLTLGSPRHAAAVLTVWGLLLGAAALRRDRPAIRRQWLIRAALVAELGAGWLLLYSVEVGVVEAYTVPFAAVALLLGALELRRRPDLSSWAAYGPALFGGFGPSVVLVLIGEDAVWRWVTLFVVAVLTVVVGSYRRRRAPVVTGGGVVLVVALVEMVRLLIRGQIAGAVLVALAGAVLVGFGALSEQRRRSLRDMS